MKLNFTSQQYNLLAPYRSYFQTAVHERWSRNPGRTALTVMADVWREVAHLPGFRMDYNCGTCIVNLLTDLGTLFFQDEAALAAEAAKPAPKVETTDAPTETVKAKAVKTGSKKPAKKGGAKA